MAYASSAAVSPAQTPGHWLLARLGKRVLRPGGVELTRRMLDALSIDTRDSVIELAPGLGGTARTVLVARPASYIGVERDASAVSFLLRKFPGVRFVQGTAEDTGLPGEIATVLFGEAMLTMHPHDLKKGVVDEAWRLLRNRGRYAIHELCLTESGKAMRGEIQSAIAAAVRDDIQLLTTSEWHELLSASGFRILHDLRAPMHLLRAGRMLRDEGPSRAAVIAFNLIRDAAARQQVVAMRRTLRKYEDHIEAIVIVAEKRY
jgi:hypothetical protein